MRVFKSEDEEQKFVHNEDDDFTACFAFGEWFDRKVVDITTMKELDLEEHYYDMLSIFRQAKKALQSF